MPGYSVKKASVKENNKEDIMKIIEKEYVKFGKAIKKHRMKSMIEGSDKLTVFAITDNGIGEKELSKEEIMDHILQYSSTPPPNYMNMKTYKTLRGVTVDSKKYKMLIKKGGKESKQGKIYETSKIIKSS